MKLSIYNNFLELTEKSSLIYNSFSNKYIIFPSSYRDKVNEDSCDLIKNSLPLFFNQLVEIGGLVEDEMDEFELLRNRMTQVSNSNTHYQLTINPTINCNFKCWYCYEQHLPKSKMDNATLSSAMKFITNIASDSKIKFFHLGFFGGEPLLYFKEVVHPILKHYNIVCASNNIDTHISFTSNGYLINDEMVILLKQNKVNFFQITLDGSKDQHNKVRYPYKGGNSYDKIISNILKLIHNQIRVVLRINYTADNFFSIKEIAKDLAQISGTDKKYLSLDFQRVWQDEKNEKIISEECLEECMSLFISMNFLVTKRLQNLNMVWKPCYADKTNQALINFNGDIYKCTARDFIHANRLGYLTKDGEIKWDEEKLLCRNGLRLTKEVCQTCRIAPLCGGGCSQRIMENKKEQACLIGYNENAKNRVVLDKFYNNVVKI